MSPQNNHPSQPNGSNSNIKTPKKSSPTPETPPHPHPKLPQPKDSKSLLAKTTNNPATTTSNPRLQITPSLPTRTRKDQQELTTDLYLTFPELVFISNRLCPSAHKPLFLGQTAYQFPYPSPQADAKSNPPAKPTNVGAGRRPSPLGTIQETELEERAKPQRRNDQENYRGGFQRHEASQRKHGSNGYPTSRSTPFKQPTLMEALKLKANKGRSEILTSFANNRKKWPSWNKTGHGSGMGG